MSDYKCPYCGLDYEHDEDSRENDEYVNLYVKCVCGNTFSSWFFYKPIYTSRKILFPKVDDAETIAEECLLLGLSKHNFNGIYSNYIYEKERLVSMLTPISNETIPLRENYPMVVWHDGRFKARIMYHYDDYEGIRYVYDRCDFEKVASEWRRTIQFVKEG